MKSFFHPYSVLFIAVFVGLICYFISKNFRHRHILEIIAGVPILTFFTGYIMFFIISWTDYYIRTIILQMQSSSLLSQFVLSFILSVLFFITIALYTGGYLLFIRYLYRYWMLVRLEHFFLEKEKDLEKKLKEEEKKVPMLKKPIDAIIRYLDRLIFITHKIIKSTKYQSHVQFGLTKSGIAIFILLLAIPIFFFIKALIINITVSSLLVILVVWMLLILLLLIGLDIRYNLIHKEKMEPVSVKL